MNTASRLVLSLFTLGVILVAVSLTAAFHGLHWWVVFWAGALLMFSTFTLAGLAWLDQHTTKGHDR